MKVNNWIWKRQLMKTTTTSKLRQLWITTISFETILEKQTSTKNDNNFKTKRNIKKFGRKQQQAFLMLKTTVVYDSTWSHLNRFSHKYFDWYTFNKVWSVRQW